MKQRALKFFLVLLSLFLIIEIIARIFFHETLTNAAWRPAVYYPDSVVNYTYIPNYDFIRGNKKLHFNKDGFIGPDFPPKNDTIFRIIVMGDSWTSGALHSIYYSTFARELAHIFHTKGYRVEILNCGIDGKNKGYDFFKLIPYKIAGLQPDMILMSSSLPLQSDNIVRETYRGYLMTYPKGQEDSIRTREMKTIDNLNQIKPFIDAVYPLYITKILAKLIYLFESEKPCCIMDYSLLYQTGVISKHYRDSSAMTILSMEESAYKIKHLQDSLRKMNISFYLYNILLKNSDFQVAKAYNLPYMNLKMDLSESAGEILPFDGHPTKLGNFLIAHRFFELLTNYHIIPKKYCPHKEHTLSKI